MDWSILLFVWANMLGIIALVLWRENKRVDAASAGAEAVKSLLEQYQRSQVVSAETAKHAIEIVAKQQQAVLDKISGEYRLILQHDAAMSIGHAKAMLACLQRMVQEHGHLDLKLLSTFLIAEQTSANRVAGNGSATDLVSAIDRMNAGRINLGSNHSTEEEPETVSPLNQ